MCLIDCVGIRKWYLTPGFELVQALLAKMVAPRCLCLSLIPKSKKSGARRLR
ncbi:MAG: hypothetical protein ACI915_004641 [Gammaproteobacteria bacterium]